MSEHLHPYGSVFYYDADGTGSYTALTDDISIEGPEGTFGKSNDTTLSAVNRLKINTAGWLEMSEPKFTGYFHKTAFAVLQAIFYARTVYYWRIVAPLLSTESTGSQLDWQGWICKWKYLKEIKESSEDKLQFEFSIEITTRPTFTAGS